MPTLLMRLEGPLQSWGSQSRFVNRTTEQAPTKSGVFGILAAARGQRRSEPLTDLLTLSFGVRVEQEGALVRDFQTERTLDGSESMPLSYRYYLGDAVFLAAVGSEDRELLSGLERAIRSPVFPLYLGRRSCPPAGPIHTQIVDLPLDEALAGAAWQASPRHQKTVASPTVTLRVLVDADPQDDEAETFRDEPISFDPERREYGWRRVRSFYTAVDNPQQSSATPGRGRPRHDPMSLIPEGS